MSPNRNLPSSRQEISVDENEIGYFKDERIIIYELKKQAGLNNTDCICGRKYKDKGKYRDEHISKCPTHLAMIAYASMMQKTVTELDKARKQNQVLLSKLSCISDVATVYDAA